MFTAGFTIMGILYVTTFIILAKLNYVYCRLHNHGDFIRQTVLEILDCKSNNKLPTCCSSIYNNQSNSLFYHLKSNATERSEVCSLKKIYVPSPYEELQFKIAPTLGNNRSAIMKFMTSSEEMKASNAWLERVRIRTHSENDPEETVDDTKYLSYFSITKKCGEYAETWKEWIEPITLHTRHPYSYFRYLNPTDVSDTKSFKSSVDIGDFNYILYQSAKSFLRSTSQNNFNFRTILLDAGCASAFQSSSKLLACAYSQRGFRVDDIYSWEITRQDPKKWWKSVPTEFRWKLHYYNIPVVSTEDGDDNPLTVIRNMATENDFVSFKLDIDTPEVEIPIALKLLEDPTLLALVDEYFFEFHYTCIIFDREEKDLLGLKMDRIGAMTYFKQLREKGLRAHAWP
eukprot:gene3143-6182_t